jgi:hypothetical protein
MDQDDLHVFSRSRFLSRFSRDGKFGRMLKKPPVPYRSSAPAARKTARNALGAVDFLHAHDRMASLLPTAMRIAALQKDCAETLPEMFSSCEVLQFESEKLVLSVPGAALAARLKQTLPRLMDGLAKRGWQVSSVKLKVQVRQTGRSIVRQKQIAMSATALNAFLELENALEKKPHNDALRDALRALVQRHQQGKRG